MSSPQRNLLADRKWIVMVPIAMGIFMSALDVGAVNIALPTVSAHFDADLSTIQWVVSIYLLVLGATLLPMGRAADLLGRKRLYVTGFVIFIAGSVLAGAAQNIEWLLVARACQAAGAAAVQATGLAIAISTFPENERGKVLGTVVTIVGLGIVAGPVVGGGVIDLFGWRAAFFINGVVGPIGLILAARIISNDRDPTQAKGRLDVVGMLTSALFLVAAVFFVSRGNAAGWGSSTIVGAGALAGIALALFLLHESRTKDPMIDLALFRRKAFALGSFASFLAFSAIVSSAFMVPFYIQGVLDISPARSGLILAPQAVMLAVAGAVFGRLSDRVDRRILATAGMSLTTASLLVLSRLDTDSGLLEVIVPLMGVSLGMGMFSPANNGSVVNSVEPERYGLVSGFLALMRTIGQVYGIAVATLIVSIAITSFGIEPDIGALRDEVKEPSRLLIDGFITGMQRVYLFGAAMSGMAAILSLTKRGARYGDQAVDQELLATRDG